MLKYSFTQITVDLIKVSVRFEREFQGKAPTCTRGIFLFHSKLYDSYFQQYGNTKQSSSFGKCTNRKVNNTPVAVQANIGSGRKILWDSPRERADSNEIVRDIWMGKGSLRQLL